MSSPHRVPAAILFAAAATLSGCAATLKAPQPGPHRVTINFQADQAAKRDCPVSVTVEPAKQCQDATKGKAACLETYAGAEVVFVADEQDYPAGTGELEYSLDFDPFTKGNHIVRGKKGKEQRLILDPKSPPKAYTYNIFSGTCPVLDPQIIIREP